MDSLSLVILLGLALTFMPGSYGFDLAVKAVTHRSRARRSGHLRMSDEKGMVGGILDIKKTVFGKLKPVLPLLGFYAVMNLPIYGVGAFGSKGSDGLGAMTDFSTITNRGQGRLISNEFLVAPAGVAPKARVVKAPQYGIDKKELAKIIDKVIMSGSVTGGRITPIAIDDSTGRMEYVQRTPIFNFPDVITVMPVSCGPSCSSVAVHSYSIYGAADGGVNTKRVKGWLEEIEEGVKQQTSIEKLKNPAMSGIPLL